MPHIPFRAGRLSARRFATATAVALAGVALCAAPATAEPAPPANDDFANAQTITLDGSGNASAVTGNTGTATREAGEPLIRTETSGSVWYRVTSPVDRPLVIDTCSAADFDTMIGVYTGTSVAALQRVVDNDDGRDCADYRSRVNFLAEAGVTYAIQVDGYDTGSGTFTLETTTGILAPAVSPWFGHTVNPHINRPVLGTDAPQIRASTTCAMDSGPAHACTLPYVVPNATSLGEGPHTFQAQYLLAPYSSPLAVANFNVDTTPPTVEVVEGPADGATLAPDAAVWSFRTNEDYPNVTCDLDGIEVYCDSTTGDGRDYVVEFAELCNGPHSLAVRTTDDAGNRGPASATRTFTVAGGSACAAPAFGPDAPRPDYPGSTQANMYTSVVAPKAGMRQYIEYGTTTAYGSTSTFVGSRVDETDVYTSIDFLAPATTYHARWVLENAHGRAVSDDFTFTTEAAEGPGAPVSISSVTEITETSAVLTAETPSTWETGARFEYGTTAAYGSATPTSWGAGPLVKKISGLLPRTTYHYRLVATTWGTRAETVDGTFTTGPVDVPVVVPSGPAPGPSPAPAPPATNRRTTQITKDLRSSLRKVKLSRKALRKGTRIPMKVKTRSKGVVRASGTLRRGKSKKAITIGNVKKSAKKSGTVSIKMPVSKKARREARRSGKLTVTLKAQFTPAGSKKPVSVTRKVTIK